MNMPALLTCLFARVDIFESLRRHSQNSSRIDPTDVLLTAAFFGGLIILLYVLSRLFTRGEKSAATNNPRRLFWSLCTEHGLSYSQRWLLWQIARRLRLDHAALLFVEPELLDAESLDDLFAARAADIKSLRERLFGGLG